MLNRDCAANIPRRILLELRERVIPVAYYFLHFIEALWYLATNIMQQINDVKYQSAWTIRTRENAVGTSRHVIDLF